MVKFASLFSSNTSARTLAFDKSSILAVYCPHPRDDGTWTAQQQGPNYVLFPRDTATVQNPTDAVPLTYADYFGPGNIGEHDPLTGQPIDPGRRFDLPLELVKEMMLKVIAATITREAFRYVSGGSSVGGDPLLVGPPEAEPNPVADPVADLAAEVETGGGGPESPVDEMEYERYGEDWDAYMSDVSDVL